MEAPISSEPTLRKPNFLTRFFKKITPQGKTQNDPQVTNTAAELTLQQPQQIKTSKPEEPMPQSIIQDAQVPKVPAEVLTQLGATTEEKSVPQQLSQSEVPKPEPIKELNIGTKFLEILKQKEAIISADKYIESQGEKADRGTTNETLDHNLVEKLRSQKEAPNGYLIGIGIGNATNMLKLFPEGQIPKAVILFDIDQGIVSEGKRLIEKFKNEPDEQNSVSWVLPDNIDMDTLRYVRSDPEKLENRLDTILKKLAKEGNLIIERADFTDQRVIDALNELPNIHESNNVIYLSNIADHVHRNGKMPDFNHLNLLTPHAPHKNYYVDTLQSSLAYNLRIGINVPQFNQKQFEMPSRLQIEPIDQIEESTGENPLWQDMSSWNIQQLMEAYSQCMSTPRQQDRIKSIEKRITDQRENALKNYDDWKQRAQNPLTEEMKKYKEKYIVPDDPTEEERIKRELTIPYDYAKDFIPIVASNIWGNAITPDQIRYTAYKTSVDAYEYGPKDNRGLEELLYIITDPRLYEKGNVERTYLMDGTPFEELLAAKIYREIQRRNSTNLPLSSK